MQSYLGQPLPSQPETPKNEKLLLICEAKRSQNSNLVTDQSPTQPTSINLVLGSNKRQAAIVERGPNQQQTQSYDMTTT